ncbi:hypothetical protein AKJ16_DCAP18668 [Drosera capensis]
MPELTTGAGAVCFPQAIFATYVALALVDGSLAALALIQLKRIHSRNTQLGWTRQMVFHLMIGSANLGKKVILLSDSSLHVFSCCSFSLLYADIFSRVVREGYFTYFVLMLIATCEGWPCWSSTCGFVFMACPEILFLAAFLLMLSYWVDLCHQNDNEDDEEGSSSQERLLEKSLSQLNSSDTDVLQGCFPLPSIHVGNRQKIVIWVTVVIFLFMVVFAVLIWVGMGKNPIDSATIEQIYGDLFAVAVLLVGLALACYGLLIYMKMSKVRFERASSEMWKVTGLAVVSLLCFTTNSLIALLTNIPVLYQWRQQSLHVGSTTFTVILYYFLGSSVPSAFVLWVMKDLPASSVAYKPDESRVVTFMREESTGGHNPQRWTTIASSQNETVSIFLFKVLLEWLGAFAFNLLAACEESYFKRKSNIILLSLHKSIMEWVIITRTVREFSKLKVELTGVPSIMPKRRQSGPIVLPPPPSFTCAYG